MASRPGSGSYSRLALTGIVAAFLGAITLRLGGHFLPLGTIAWGLSIYFLFGNMDALGRNNGITGVPPIFDRLDFVRAQRSDLLSDLGRARCGDHLLIAQPSRIRARGGPFAACAAAS